MLTTYLRTVWKDTKIFLWTIQELMSAISQTKHFKLPELILCSKLGWHLLEKSKPDFPTIVDTIS